METINVFATLGGCDSGGEIFGSKRSAFWRFHDPRYYFLMLLYGFICRSSIVVCAVSMAPEYRPTSFPPSHGDFIIASDLLYAENNKKRMAGKTDHRHQLSLLPACVMINLLLSISRQEGGGELLNNVTKQQHHPHDDHHDDGLMMMLYQWAVLCSSTQ